jgi:hypothetical protein
VRILLALQFLVCAVLATASSAIAQQTTPETGPVRVASCIVMSRDPAVSVMRPGVSLTNGVTVALVNSSNKTTSAVTVTGNYHGRVVTDTVKLELKPGDTTEVFKQYTPSVFIDIYADCHVTHVDFTDGTSWSLPGAPTKP